MCPIRHCDCAFWLKRPSYWIACAKLKTLAVCTNVLLPQSNRFWENWLVQAMHELAIMDSALTVVSDRGQLAGASRVHMIRLRIGVLSGVVPEALEFAFEALVPGTPAEGAQLAIESVPARFWCATCR